MLPRLSTALFITLTLVTVSPAAVHTQTAGSCPNERATLVREARGILPPWRTCYMRVHVLGMWISLANGRCPTGRTLIAAHSECLGAAGEGTLCEDNGVVGIQYEQCRCRPLPGHTPWVSSCQCEAIGSIGFVTTGATTQCH